MNILIVEDSEKKLKRLENFILNNVERCSVKKKTSLHDGLKALVEESFDAVILDMTMPTYSTGEKESGGQPRPYAGREILQQMERRNIDVHVLVVTQFERFGDGSDVMTISELDSQLEREHSDNYMGYVQFSWIEEGWRESLSSKLDKIVKNR